MSYHVALEPRPMGRRIQQSELVAQGLKPIAGDGWTGLQVSGPKPFVLYCSNGEWFAERLDDDQLGTLMKIAKSVNAVVTGDEGESYDVADGALTHRPLPPKEREFCFHRLNPWVALVLVMAIFALIATLVRN